MSFIGSYNPHLLDGVQHVHFIGCGGSGTYPLIQILHSRGLTISGSDVEETKITKAERAMGVTVYLEHDAAHLGDAQLVVYSAAIHDENPELKAARARGIPAVERSVMLGYVSRMYSHSVCVSGTHGKTTTTSMCTHIAMAARVDPTVMIGGTLPILGTGHRVGKGKTIILESCEYCNSFLSFYPTLAVILNIEADHLDFFKDLEDVEHAFRAFADLVPPGGTVLANGEDANTMKALEGKEGVLTFGLEKGTFHAENLTWDHGFPSFDVVWNGKPAVHVALQVPGEHNVKNAIAAAAAALLLGMPSQAVAQGLRDFRGAGRRFEYKGMVKGAAVYDDYAHHPGELKALLETAASLGYQRVICAFQPHTYTRTKALFSEFAAVLQQADVTFLAEIFAAREKNEVGISSQDLAAAVPGARAAKNFDQLTQWLYDLARPGDLILTVGAGDIYTVGEELVRRGQMEST